MKIYEFYSDWNDKYRRDIPDEIKNGVEYYDDVMPKKYRSHINDIFITGVS